MKLRASGSQCGFSVWRNNGGQERTCKGKSDVRATWDFSGCNVDVSVDSTARCRGLDVTFSHDTVTPLGFLFQILHFQVMSSTQTNWSPFHTCSRHTGLIPKHNTIYLLCSGEKVNAICKRIYVKIHTYMCVLHFLCIYIPMYPYSLMRGNLIFCDRFVAELPSYSAHTSSDTYLVSEALVRPLSNVSSSVYYCH